MKKVIFIFFVLIMRLMKKVLFTVLILIILAAIGAVFYNWQRGSNANLFALRPSEPISNFFRKVYNWQGKKILMKDESATPSTALRPQETPEVLPSGATVEPTPSYQKPAENAITKFPIFNYHHIRPMPSIASSTITDRAFTVSPEGLEAHLRYFKNNNYQVVSVYDLLDYFDTGRPLPKKAVAITFDDGYFGQYQWAYPLLKKYSVTATFFIIVNNVGQPGVLTWEEIKEMSEDGMFIGSHALSHPHLSALDDEQLRKELVDSKRILEEKIGRRVDLLSYPGGDYNERVIQFVKDAGYQAALSVYKIIEQAPKFRYTIRRFHADDWLESITEKMVDY